MTTTSFVPCLWIAFESWVGRGRTRIADTAPAERIKGRAISSGWLPARKNSTWLVWWPSLTYRCEDSSRGGWDEMDGRVITVFITLVLVFLCRLLFPQLLLFVPNFDVGWVKVSQTIKSPRNVHIIYYHHWVDKHQSFITLPQKQKQKRSLLTSGGRRTEVGAIKRNIVPHSTPGIPSSSRMGSAYEVELTKALGIMLL